MPYFAQLREEKTSLFYQKLWSEFESIKVYDTHEHYQFPTYWNQQLEKTGLLTPQILGGSYVYNFPTALDYNAWASAAHDYQFTGYFRSFLWGIEELYGIEPPATPAYFELLETQLKEIYCVDDGGLGHMKDIIENRMHVDHTLANIGIDEHLQFRNMIPGHGCCGRHRRSIRIRSLSLGRIIPIWVLFIVLRSNGCIKIWRIFKF